MRVDSETRKRLDEIAEVIRIDPGATGQQIAVALSFSETRSIYYWLKKGKFKGLKHFKNEVLTGNFPPLQPHTTLLERQKEYITELLVADGYNLDTPRWTGGKIHVLKDYGPNCYALAFPDTHHRPWLSQGDLVIIDPVEEPSAGGYVLFQQKDAAELKLCRYQTTPMPLAVDLFSGEVQEMGSLLLTHTLLGQLRSLIREF